MAPDISATCKTEPGADGPAEVRIILELPRLPKKTPRSRKMIPGNDLARVGRQPECRANAEQLDEPVYFADDNYQEWRNHQAQLA
ncbi:hypothetical protein AbraIFM66950_002397 [Aspergillus brasiliensis]|nr:hypothetical protein AbraIFM66950_002397 [Aspergillus brasiliensis]